MTTEQKLREALEELQKHSDCLCNEAADIVRAALALPVSEVREEWRVSFEWLIEFSSGTWSQSYRPVKDRADAEAGKSWRMTSKHRGVPEYRNIRIESRTVSTSPWAALKEPK